MAYIIAEVGGNHNGSIDIALQLVEEAARAGADAVKFQTYQAESLVHSSEPPLPQAGTAYKSQSDRFKSMELSKEEWLAIIDACKTHSIDFLTTCFDIEMLEYFEPYMSIIKISSGDLTYHELIRKAASFGKPVYLSTGMASYAEIQHAAGIVPEDLLTVMHCVSVYPTPPNHANLGVIRQLQDYYLNVGYSDHTIGNEACLAAVAMGAEVIEKHFTLDKDQAPGDHILSADPDDMFDLVNHIRRLEKMLGHNKPDPIEVDMRRRMRRGVYAAKPIEAGKVIECADLLYVRPDNGCRHNMVGRRAIKDYKVNEGIHG